MVPAALVRPNNFLVSNEICGHYPYSSFENIQMSLLHCVKRMPGGPESNFFSFGILFCYFLDALILDFCNIVNSRGKVSGCVNMTFDSK